MIIKSKPLPFFLLKMAGYLVERVLKSRLNKLVINPIEIKPGHSYILLCNHFGFGDGFLGFYLAWKVILKQGQMKRLYIMSVKKQMQKNRWLRYCGSFSVEPGKVSIRESFAYAAEQLAEPGNLLLFFPQGNLESCHIRSIKFQEGIAEIIPLIKGNCQIIWTSNIIEYFESLSPSVYFNMLDCGINHNFDFDTLKQQVNQHHLQSIKQNIRFTDEEN
jgi:1-acyl-sn-glycerol-3-phosphate acyltransferase